MSGIQYVVDDKGRRQAVVIDLRKYSRIWEDFCDCLLSGRRAREPREALSAVKSRLRKLGKLDD